MKWRVVAVMALMSGQILAGAQAVSSRFVDVNGLSIHYLEAGSAMPDAPMLLFVHGWCGSAEDFRSLIEALPDSYHSVAVDLPGFGLSAKPDATYDTAYFVAFLRSFTETTGFASFVMVGHSMGGQFAVHYTTRWPESVQRLILIDPYGLTGEEGWMLPLARLGPLVDLAFALNNRLFIEWATVGNVMYRPDPAIARAAAAATAVSILGPGGPRAAARVTKSVIGHDGTDALLPEVTAETLVIWGDHDTMLAPRWAARFLALLPSARLAVIPDTGHMPMTEKPALAAAEIARFLSEIPRSAKAD